LRDVFDRVDTKLEESLALLSDFCRIPSISAEKRSQPKAAAFARKMLAEAGVDAREVPVDGGPPVVYEYRIARDAQGRPERDADGKAVVAFGPGDHSDPEQWKAVTRYWKLLRIAKMLPGSSRLLWTK